jgi:uncharacterized membrane protein YkvI
MRHSPILSTTLVISIVSLAGCEIAGDIFKAGVWVGAILVIGIIGLLSGCEFRNHQPTTMRKLAM